MKLKTDKCAINKHEKSRSCKKNISSPYNSFKLTDSEKWANTAAVLILMNFALPPNLGKAFPHM